MLTRRNFVRALGAFLAVLAMPALAWSREYYTTFTKPVPAEDIGLSPKWFVDGLVSPVEKRPGDVVIRDIEGIAHAGRSNWAYRDGSTVYLGTGSRGMHVKDPRTFSV